MNKRACIFLNLLDLSPKKIESILSFGKNLGNILKADRKYLSQIPLISNRDIEKILAIKNSSLLDDELKNIERNKISVIDIFDSNYPKLLKEIDYPPLVLYVKGNLSVLNKLCFAIVGTRLPTVYGISMAYGYAYKLSALGFVIVSGMARGIDTASHEGAIERGETIAVLGSGLNCIYPKENKILADQIVKDGALVSEFPLETTPLRENFPRRNRIISGLSRAVLVVEAASRSGALITARRACEQNREVFALPGQADSPLSKGTHLLIKEGAKLVDSVDDILEELNIELAYYE